WSVNTAGMSRTCSRKSCGAGLSSLASDQLGMAKALGQANSATLLPGEPRMKTRFGRISEATSRTLPAGSLARMTGAPSSYKGPIRCHEACQHGHYELAGIADWLSALVSHGFRIGHEIAMNGRGQLDAQLYRFILGPRFNRELRHLPSSPIRFEQGSRPSDQPH